MKPSAQSSFCSQLSEFDEIHIPGEASRKQLSPSLQSEFSSQFEKSGLLSLHTFWVGVFGAQMRENGQSSSELHSRFPFLSTHIFCSASHINSIWQ